jgi:hypothetical protein
MGDKETNEQIEAMKERQKKRIKEAFTTPLKTVTVPVKLYSFDSPELGTMNITFFEDGLCLENIKINEFTKDMLKNKKAFVFFNSKSKKAKAVIVNDERGIDVSSYQYRKWLPLIIDTNDYL